MRSLVMGDLVVSIGRPELQFWSILFSVRVVLLCFVISTIRSVSLGCSPGVRVVDVLFLLCVVMKSVTATEHGERFLKQLQPLLDFVFNSSSLL